MIPLVVVLTGRGLWARDIRGPWATGQGYQYPWGCPETGTTAAPKGRRPEPALWPAALLGAGAKEVAPPAIAIRGGRDFDVTSAVAV